MTGVVGRAFAVLALAAVVSGCVLDRIFATHDQLCKSSPREVVIEGGAGAPLRVVFERPTLTRDDIEWLVGLPPTRVVDAADGVRLQFAAAPAGRAQDEGPTLVTELRFVPIDGQMKLAESLPPAHLAQVLPRELIDRAVAAACKPELSLAPPGARFDIASIDANVLPDRRRIESILGPPHERDADGTYVYRFCLLPCNDGARPLARLAYRFGPDGRLERGDFAYFRYRLLVDRPSGVATLTLRLT
ncbi:MAG TPA: hypothetical protein VII68_17905 [Casimicrobiaceae bacterium]|jgi:hypothetical protein